MRLFIEKQKGIIKKYFKKKPTQNTNWKETIEENNVPNNWVVFGEN